MDCKGGVETRLQEVGEWWANSMEQRKLDRFDMKWDLDQIYRDDGDIYLLKTCPFTGLICRCRERSAIQHSHVPCSAGGLLTT